MDSHSRILLSEATQLVCATRRRIELTSALLGIAARANALPGPRGLRPSGRGIEPLEDGERELGAAGRLNLGVHGELHAQRGAGAGAQGPLRTQG